MRRTLIAHAAILTLDTLPAAAQSVPFATADGSLNQLGDRYFGYDVTPQ